MTNSVKMLRAGSLTLLLSAASLTFLAGCKAKPVGDDVLQSKIQSQLAADSALTGQPVTVAVQNGVATLNGSVGNDAQRSIAARDAAGVAGVTEVVNSIVTGAPTAAANAPLSAPAYVAPAPKPAAGRSAVDAERDRDRDRYRDEHQPAPIQRVPPPQQQAYNNPAPQPQAPPPPSQPVFRNVTIPAGTSLPVRVTQTLDSATSQQGDPFSGVITADVIIDGAVAIPAGSSVSGQADQVHEAGHFKGASLLAVSLNTVSRRGERIAITTDPYTVEGKGRGKNTLEKSGIGAAGGAILGGIFGGGKGAAIGAAAGGGAGAGINGVTRGQQVQIPSESVVRFRLTTPITVRVRADGGHDDHGGDGLQRRPGL